MTHAPNSGSPAIDAGHPTVCVAIDQRFYARPFNGRCDMGAYEVGAQGVVSGSVTFIAYNYDGLYRLTNANYSGGQTFSYTYDAMGNTLQMAKVTAGQTATTTYAYNNGNQLVTALASDNPTTWHYAYDANGRLTDIMPNGTSPANGARHYTYNAAGYLLKAELHNGTAYQPQAEMQYNGAGGRATMTAWQGGISATSTYALDLAKNGRVLSANSGGSVTSYLYNNTGPLAELTTSWAYYLPDGTDTVRQLTNGTGAVTLSRAYTPWGEVLTQSGTGNFAWGYFGGLMDAATGLLYVGSGQYYDPATGRFLTPVNTTGPNPYVPWRGNPLGAMFAPFGLLAFLGRKRKKGKYDQLLLMLVVLVGVSMGLAACGTPTPPPPTEDDQPPTVPPSPTPTPTPTPTPIPVAKCGYGVADSTNHVTEEGFDPIAFKACRAEANRLRSFGINYQEREVWAGDDQFSYFNWAAKEICPAGGPTYYENTCIQFQQPTDIRAVVLHHMGDPFTAIENVRTGHLDDSNFDQVDIAFHFAVLKTGEVIEGRPMLVRGSATRHGNIGSIAIELEGNFNTERPTQQQIEATIALMNAIKSPILPNLWAFSTHRDVGLSYPDTDFRHYYTACPGDLFYEDLTTGLFQQVEQRTGLHYKQSPLDWGTTIPGTATPPTP